jgi:predicted Rossmann fold nucleotide-binding protein DprA/Smf involved in DNA uptake
MLSTLEAGGAVVGVLSDSLIKASVAGKYRPGIRDGRLVLLSSFYPNARFNIGNAMARNKYIYALADFALIVNAEVNKGGTWTGAMEELKRGSAHPVFVRNELNAPEGNRALLQQGALPFPLQPWKQNLALLLKDKVDDRHRKIASQRSLFGDTEIPSIKEETEHFQTNEVTVEDAKLEQERIQSKKPQSVYQAVLPILMAALIDWKSPKYLMEKLNVRMTQLDDWLKRAVKEGKVEKKNRPARYRRKLL